MRLFPAMILSLFMCTGPSMAFDLTSPDVAEGSSLKPAQVANAFGCSGGNISPELHWTDPPDGTKSFAVTMYDPDAPTDSGFWHWVVFDIPADVRGLASGAGNTEGRGMPDGAIQSSDDANINGYLGACPPPGKPHRYIITVKALKVEKLGLDPTASGALVGFMSNANLLGKASITATYGQ